MHSLFPTRQRLKSPESTSDHITNHVTGLDWLDKVHSFLECAVNVSDGAYPRILILWGAFALCGLICTKSFLIFDFPGNGS